MPASTIKDIARETGLSLATISKYLNGGNVRPDNRAAIEAAIKKLDYHPNESARSVRGVTRKMIAVVVPSISVDYCRILFLTCQQFLIEYDYGLLLINYNNDSKHEQVAVNNALNNAISGIIAIPKAPDAECYQRARKLGTPLLFIFSDELPNAHSVVLRDHNAISEVVSSICEGGHERVGIISGTTEQHIYDRRVDIIRTLLRSHGCALGEELMYISNGAALDIGHEGAEYMLSLQKPPTAIICLNGELLLGAKIAILEHRLRIPADISLTGITECTMTESAVLNGVTSISYPITTAAKEAVRIIMKSIEDRWNGLSPEYVTTGFYATAHWAGSIGTIIK